MSSLEELRADRIKKRDRLISAGMNPYPSSSEITHSIAHVVNTFRQLCESESSSTIGGRVLSVRRHGGSMFVDIFDGRASIQLFLARNVLGDSSFSLFSETIDPGDFIQVTGTCFLTKRDAQAIQVTEWKILTKSLQAIPPSYYGLKDDEERLRKRYLDFTLNPDQQELFALKQRFWDVIRVHMKEAGFLEVETPTLEVTTGGAEARPFKTYHNDYDLDMYLRISVGELWQKQLMAAGFTKVFEIGRVYRNEGTSAEHLQEFTNLEFYWAYADYRDGMEFVKKLYRKIGEEVFGTTRFSVRGHTFDLADEWREIDYVEEIERQTGVNVVTSTESELQSTLDTLQVTYEGHGRERLTDTLWKYCRKHISGPAFLVNHPVMVAPLAKRRNDGETVEMFQPILAGSEVGRGYSELNDPEDQRQRFVAQQQLLEAGDEEAMMPDWDFVEMLEYGMPPTCGFGFGERLFAFLIGKPIRETQLFPLVKPKE